MNNFTLNSISQYLFIAFALYNIVVFVIYGLDKFSASSKSWRISEKALLLLTLFFGSPGAILGINVFRHKTRKTSFQFWLFLILLFQAGIGCFIYRYFDK